MNPRDYNHNSFERGIARDEHGLPYLDERLQPVGVKEFAERRNSGAWDHPGRQVSTPTPIRTA